MATPFRFTLPSGDSASLALVLTDAPDLSGWAITFAAGAVVKTSAGGDIVIGTPTGITITIEAGDFATVGAIPATVVATSGVQQLTWYGSVVITSAETVGALTTLAKVRTYLFGAEGGPYDAESILAGLIQSSSAWVVSRLGQEVLTRTVTEVRDGNGTAAMLLRQFPVASVTSVTIDDTALLTTAYSVRDGKVELEDSYFTAGTANVTIVYTAGVSVCPYDLEQAVIEHVALRYRDRTRAGLGSQSSGGESATFSDAGTLAYIEGVLTASPLNALAMA